MFAIFSRANVAAYDGAAAGTAVPQTFSWNPLAISVAATSGGQPSSSEDPFT